ncbi:hypothetical protein AB6A40_000380 [Gnathostoma spinigerum]|uniref:Uncharacterized protein n=1 Tax=Gnathostoma spinigerum TaxID=75299 RepID=A0ABD6E381_9BILA
MGRIMAVIGLLLLLLPLSQGKPEALEAEVENALNDTDFMSDAYDPRNNGSGVTSSVSPFTNDPSVLGNRTTRPPELKSAAPGPASIVLSVEIGVLFALILDSSFIYLSKPT